MTALEANKIAREREKFGLLIDAIEKEAKQGSFRLIVNHIDIGEAVYCLSEEETEWLESNGYHICIEDSLVDFDPEIVIIYWTL